MIYSEFEGKSLRWEKLSTRTKQMQSLFGGFTVVLIYLFSYTLLLINCFHVVNQLKALILRSSNMKLESVYKPAVQNNADTGSVHKLHSILPKNLPQTSLFSLQI